MSGAFVSIQFLAFSFYFGDSMLHVHICGSCAGYDSSLKLVYNTNLNDGFVNVYLWVNNISKDCFCSEFPYLMAVQGIL